MPRLVEAPVRIEAAGNKPNQIEEFVGGPSSGTPALSVERGEWVRYSTPGGAVHVAVCLPAFSPDTVHRDEGA